MFVEGDYYLHLKKLRVKDYEDRYEDITTKINKVIIFIYILLILISFFFWDYKTIDRIISGLVYFNMLVMICFYLLNVKERISYVKNLGFKETNFRIKIRKKNFYFSNEFNEIMIPDIHIYYVKYKKTLLQNLKFTIITGDKRYFFYISSRENRLEYERFYSELKSKKIEKEKFWNESVVGAGIVLLIYALYKII